MEDLLETTRAGFDRISQLLACFNIVNPVFFRSHRW